MITKFTEKVQKFFSCPACGEAEAFSYGHLVEKAATGGQEYSWGSWYCDECGAGVRGAVQVDGTTTVELTGEKNIETRVLLKLDSSSPIFLIVRGHWRPEPGATANDGDEYFFNEHTCPTNYLKDVIAIFEGDDSDPHGLFKYVAAVPEAVARPLTIESTAPHKAPRDLHRDADWTDEVVKTLFDVDVNGR